MTFLPVIIVIGGVLLVAMSGASSDRRPHRVPAPTYLSPETIRQRYPTIRSSLVQPLEPPLMRHEAGGWILTFLPTVEDLIKQSKDMDHDLVRYMSPKYRSLRPTFPFSVISPAGTPEASCAVTFSPEQGYYLDEAQGHREHLPPGTQRAIRDLVETLNQL